MRRKDYDAETVLKGYKTPAPAEDKSGPAIAQIGNKSGGQQVSPAEANYRLGEDPAKQCASCLYFSPGGKQGTCSQVKGTIDPTFTCDLYASKQSDNDALDRQMFGGEE